MRDLLIGLAVLVALPGALASIHLSIVAVASLGYAPPGVAGKRLRFLVLVPAHNEESVIGQTIAAINEAKREGDIVLVVADRCTDRTAMVSRAGGSQVLDRPLDAPPGRARAVEDGIEWGLTREWDVVVTIDADSVIEPGFFEAMETVFATGTQLVQARSEHVREAGILPRISEAAFAMQGVTLPRGRDRLGVGTRLRGSGMAMTRSVARSASFSTHGVSEDLFLSLDLLLEGLTARHADDARVRSLAAPTWRAGGGQRVRWESGRLAAARVYMGRLLKHRTLPALEAAVHLATPPFAVAAFLLAIGFGSGFVLEQAWLVLSTGVLIATLAGSLAIGLVQSRAPLRTWLALAAAPVYVPWKVALQILAFARLGKAAEPYQPTARD